MNNEQENYIERPDFSALESGQRAVDGMIVDESGKAIGPLPKKRYSSHEEYMAELKGRQTTEYRSDFLLWRDIDKLKFPDNIWLIKNLIPKFGLSILASISGEGKTWIGMKMAKDMSLGNDFLGQEEFKTTQAKVLYIDAENTKSEIQRRGRQLSFTDSDQLLFKPTDQINLNTDDGFEEFEELVKKESIQVVIIDTFRAVAGGIKEEKAEEVRAFLSRFKKMKDDSVSIILLDHYRKPAQNEKKTPQKEYLFGSQDKTANSEILLMMKKEGDYISIFQRKNRLGKEIDSFRVLMTDTFVDEWQIKTDISFAGLIEDKEPKKETIKEYILDLLGSGPKATNEILNTAQKEKDIGERNTRDALKELVEKKIIKKGKVPKSNTNLYSLTETDGKDDPDKLYDEL